MRAAPLQMVLMVCQFREHDWKIAMIEFVRLFLAFHLHKWRNLFQGDQTYLMNRKFDDHKYRSYILSVSWHSTESFSSILSCSGNTSEDANHFENSWIE
jgi:hypothetical protein